MATLHVWEKLYFHKNFTMKNLLSFLGMILLLGSLDSSAQQSDSRIVAREFSIPVSPVFDFMGVSPALVSKSSDIREFKVDWSFKNWRLNPNLAIEAQPLWEILYNKKNLDKYRAASTFMRRLSSLDVSIGTIQDELGDRRIGFSGKMSLYKQRDPLMATDMYADIDLRYSQEETLYRDSLTSLSKKLDTTSNLLERAMIRQQMKGYEDMLGSQNKRRIAEMNGRSVLYAQEYWNASFVDAAVCRVLVYQVDSAGAFKKLRQNRNTGFSGWVNFGVGIGKRMMISGLLRNCWYNEEMSFVLQDENGNQTTGTALAKNTIFTAGVNFRYGGPVFNFFAEFFHEQKSISSESEALAKSFQVPEGQTVVANTIRWTNLFPTTISMGGDWRVSRSLVLNFGMRFIYDANWKFSAFNPVASVSCLMR